jgi:hypothetical protein
MPALPPKATFGYGSNVCFVPIADIGTKFSLGLFDHLICANEDRLGDVQSEVSRRLQIEYNLELCGFINREIARFRAIENLVHVGCCPPI